MSGIVESVRGVLWARKRSPEQVAYLVSLAQERFQPDDLLRQAVEAEQAGFDGVCCSDHLEPWWAPDSPTPAACGNAWVWLGAVGQATSQVVARHGRHRPAAPLQPGRPRPAGRDAREPQPGPRLPRLRVERGDERDPGRALDWPSTEEQLRRTEESLTIVKRLLDGETVDFDGEFFKAKRARLYVKTERRPPIYLSAFHEGAREVAGRLADGVWTLGDPRKAAPVIAAYRRGAEEAGREPGRDHPPDPRSLGRDRRGRARGLARVEGHARRRALHRPDRRPGGDRPERRGAGRGRAARVDGDRLGRPGHAREEAQGAREARARPRSAS